MHEEEGAPDTQQGIVLRYGSFITATCIESMTGTLGGFTPDSPFSGLLAIILSEQRVRPSESGLCRRK